MAASYRLVMQTGPLTGSVFPLEKNEIYIGRDLNNDIVINDPEVSRRHARLFLQGHNFVIEDLGSTNGTAVNEQRLIGAYVLRPGESIVFGEHISAVFEPVQQDAGRTMVAARHAPAAEAASQYAQPSSYAGRVPLANEAEELQERRIPRWLLILAVILMFSCVCVAFLIVVDLTYSWCWIFGWLFNLFSPGLCP